jgi:hypothetical protein
MAVTDCDPERHGAFRDLRLRPAMRPHVAAMTPEEACDHVAPYPALPDGRVLFSSTRVFFILERP